MPAIGNTNRQRVTLPKIKAAAQKPAPKLSKPKGPVGVLAPKSQVPKVFNAPLKQVTKQNIRTGGQLQAYGATPEGEQARLAQLHKQRPLEYFKVKGQYVHGHPQIGLALPAGIPGVNFAASTLAAGKALEGAGAVSGKSILGRAGKDVAAIGTFPFIGGYKALEGTTEALKGNTKPIKELAKGVVQSAEKGVVGQLAQGNVKGALHAVSEHPGFAATEIAGGLGALSRGAGALSRGAGAEFAQRVRPPVALEEHISPEAARRGEAVKYRTFSGDLTRKGAQVRSDLKREPVRDANGHIVTVMDRGRRVPVLRPTRKEAQHLQEQRGSFASARAVSMQREARGEASHAALEASTAPGRLPLPLRGQLRPTIKGELRPVRVAGKIAPLSAKHVAEHLAQLVTSGTLRPAHFAEDLQKHIDRIQEAVNNPKQFLHKGDLAVAEGNLALLKAAQSHPSVMGQAERIAKQGQAHGRQLNEYDQGLAEAKAYPAEQLERARLGEYAVAHMDAHMGQEGLSAPDGHLLTNKEITDHMTDHGVNPKEIAYLPHRMVTAESKSSFYKPFQPGRRIAGNEPKRTYALYKRGATALTNTLLHEELADKATALASIGQHDRMIREMGRLHPAMEKALMGEHMTPAEERVVKEGGYFNAKEAAQFAEKMEQEGLGRYLPMRAFNASLDKEAQKALIEAQSPASLENVRSKMLNDRIVKEGDNSTARNVVLVPEDYANRLIQHAAPNNFQAVRMLQMLNSPFRMAVLSQPRWLTGNFVEPYFVRLPLSGSGINIPGLATDITAGTKILKELERQDPKAAAEVRAIFFEGRFLGGKQNIVKRTTADVPITQFMDKLPAVKQLGHLIALYPKMFFAINHLGIENPTALAALGKAGRHDIQAATGSWTKTVTLADAAVKDAAKGLTNTANQHRYAEYYWELLGQYDGFRPWLKQLIQTATPFLPWTLASLRFVYWTLPAHHTVAFAGLMKIAQSVIKEWEEEHKGTPGGELQISPRNAKGGYVPVPKYTPYSISSNISDQPVKGAVEQLTNTLFPQVWSAVEAAQGRDPWHRPLKVPKTASNPKGEATEGQRGVAAINSLVEALVPIVSQARRVQEKGATPYATSTVLNPQIKPGTGDQMSALNRTFNPFRPTYLKEPKAGRHRERPERASRERPQRERRERER